VTDYSEFPTTPTRWQENLWPEPITTPEITPPPPARRQVDVPSLVAGIIFTVLAVVALSGVDLAAGWLWNGGIVWMALLIGGVGLLVTEVRRARRRH
jgi:hypothetical protein